MGKEYKKGDVLRIRPKEGVKTWCRHHIYILRENGWQDTYWSSGGGVFTYEDLVRMSDNRIIDNNQSIADMEQMPPAIYENKLNLYDSKDTLYIPMGGGSERLYIRKGAEPLKERVMEQIEQEVRERVSKIHWLSDEVQQRLRMLQEMKYTDEESDNAT